jgi:tetratricopeptide (TPR) repeat protein
MSRTGPFTWRRAVLLCRETEQAKPKEGAKRPGLFSAQSAMEDRMKKFTGLALAIAVALTTPVALHAPAAFAQKQAKGPTVSAKMAKPLIEIQKLIGAKDFAGALEKINAANAMSAKTPYDQFVINEMGFQSAMSIQNMPVAYQFLEANIDSEFLGEADRPKRIEALYVGNRDLKNWAGAEKFAMRSPRKLELLQDLAVSRYNDKDVAGAASVLDRAIAESSGKPDERLLRLRYRFAFETEDTAGQRRLMEQLAMLYSKPEYWHDILVPLQDQKGATTRLKFEVYRLMRQTGAMLRPNLFYDMAESAMSDVGLPGEAVTTLERAIKENRFTNANELSTANTLLSSGRTRAAADQKGLAQFEKEAKAAKAGEADVQLGRAFLSYGQADKAVEAIRRGLGKGSVRNMDEANISLGAALFATGNKADAKTAFQAVKGPGFADLARYWIMYLEQNPA